MTGAHQISLQRPIDTGLAVFAVKADARLALLTYARQTRRPSPDTWPLTTAKPTSKQLSTKLRAAPVRQSDHGANVSSETAITLMTIVAITTHKRPRSSAGSVRIRKRHDAALASRAITVNHVTGSGWVGRQRLTKRKAPAVSWCHSERSEAATQRTKSARPGFQSQIKFWIRAQRK